MLFSFPAWNVDELVGRGSPSVGQKQLFRGTNTLALW